MRALQQRTRDHSTAEDHGWSGWAGGLGLGAAVIAMVGLPGSSSRSQCQQLAAPAAPTPAEAEAGSSKLERLASWLQQSGADIKNIEIRPSGQVSCQIVSNQYLIAMCFFNNNNNIELSLELST